VREELARLSSSTLDRGSDDGDLARRLAAAAGAYERDRYADAKRMTRTLLSKAPGSVAARELYGLACYRLGLWEESIKHLELVVAASDDQSQIPVLMDCFRALGRFKRAEDLWEELKRASPEVDVLVEGRLVLASARAQRGDLKGAIDLLVEAGAARGLRHPAERHVRQWYLLGDLLEKSGDIPRAREMFERVVRADPGLADATDRLIGLGRPRRRQPRKTSNPAAGRKARGSD
jgi:pentatricopeptide repeat protein